MAVEEKNEEAVFNAAIEIDSVTERAAFVKSACGDDAKLLARVEALLKVHYEDKRFLKSPPAGMDSTLDSSLLTEGPGTKIGRYKLLQLIGEGGFGVVYMAEQEKPIRRRVALKIIKLGMDTKQVIARFEAERQALAMMGHPNIARVFDAGATDTGRPYFVMELVKGIPVTEYCDKNNLDTRQRLELFIDVCKAVQHAHQKGIIHRDIKPTNVLITLRDDDTPVPKIIDFGIAKATQARLTEKTLFTEFKQFIGTPQYMSPEQARLGELDVDTRSDIYSLGVLLYELLTSTTPFDGEKLRSSAYDEMLKTIRETEPPKPSTRLNTLGDALTDVAKHRHAEPSELCKILRGDLDWIVMKTLEKDRSRRYETANELAMDIERHLGDEPVSAGPPSTVYRLRKFGRRHRRGVMFSLLVAVALLTGLCLATIGFVQANRQRNIAETQRRRAGINFQMARDAVDEMTRVVEQQLVNVSGTEQVRRELLQKAQVFYASFAEGNRDDEVVRQEIALAYQRVGVIHNHLGNFRQARKALDEAITLFESLTAEFPNVPDYREALATCWSWHAHTFIWTDRQQEMVQGRRKVVALFQKLVADFPTAVGYRASLASAHTDVGNALKMTSQPEEAEMHFRQSLHIWRKLHTDFPEMPKDLEALAHSHHWLGAYLLDFGRLAEAEKELLVALELREQLLAEDPNSAWGRERLAHIKSYVGELLTRQGKVEEAEQEFREAIAIREKLIEEFPSHIEHRRRLAVLLSRLSKALMHGGRNQEAEDALRQAIARRENLAIDFPDVAGFRYDLAKYLIWLSEMLTETDQLEEALESCREAVDIFEKLVADFPEVPEYRENLAETYRNLGDVLEKMGRLEDSLQAYQKAEEMEKEVVTEETEDSNE